MGGPDLFINAGSFINLTCTGHHLPGIPEDVFWYHESQVRAFNQVQNNTIKLIKKEGVTRPGVDKVKQKEDWWCKVQKGRLMML